MGFIVINTQDEIVMNWNETATGTLVAPPYVQRIELPLKNAWSLYGDWQGAEDTLPALPPEAVQAFVDDINQATTNQKLRDALIKFSSRLINNG